MVNLLKNTAVAWLITAAMVLAAVWIGQHKAATSPNGGAPHATPPLSAAQQWYVYDDAQVLSDREAELLREKNQLLDRQYDGVVACVTTNYGREDLYRFAMDYAEEIGLGQRDFIVVLDIAGDNYWLVQGSGLVGQFTDEDCEDYAWTYLEDDFAQGEYGSALLRLLDALDGWYHQADR